MFMIFVPKCPCNSKNVCVIFVHVLRLSNIWSLSYVALTLSKFGHPWSNTTRTPRTSPVTSARWSGVSAVPPAAEWCGCDASLFAAPLNSDSGDAAANECCCLQQVNAVSCCCWLCCTHLLNLKCETLKELLGKLISHQSKWDKLKHMKNTNAHFNIHINAHLHKQALHYKRTCRYHSIHKL
jgi:hypothetical protein